MMLFWRRFPAPQSLLTWQPGLSRCAIIRNCAPKPLTLNKSLSCASTTDSTAEFYHTSISGSTNLEQKSLTQQNNCPFLFCMLRWEFY
uniref:Uncharacterized protein n=1 Tax=Anguilla anguilla TaxID=7936 RepID=A0A0E9TNY6_ANGAN